MNFKSWFILSEELYLQNNTATIFHRTKSIEYVQQMMNGGFTAGGGAFHGPGLYTTYTLEGTTNLGYGDYVVKLKVKNLKSYFVLEPDVAKQIHGNNWKLKDQARILELTLKLTDEQWQKYQEISEKGQFGSAAASQALKSDGHKLWENGCKGIVYNGEQDGKCICVYAPYEGLHFLAYANAPTPTTVDYIEKNWVKSSKDVSIRSISDLKFPKDTGIGSTSVEKPYELEKEKNIPSKILNQIYDDLKIGKYVKLKFYLSRNKLSDEDIHNLLEVAPNKNEMINFIIKNKTEFSGGNVFDLLTNAYDKEKIARILGPENFNKLTSINVHVLILDASDKDEMINFIIKYKTELSYIDIYYLISLASDKEKIARILGPDNINKLNGQHVYFLLRNSVASDQDRIARILGPDNINKLSNLHVSGLLNNASDIDEMVRILGQENINKLDDRNVYTLLHGASDKEKMAEILRQDNINKLSGDYVHSLLASAFDKRKIERILGRDNINKLSSDHIYKLLRYTSDKEEMAKILGQENINKLDDSNVYNLLASAFDKEEMKQILRKYYTGTNQEVISLLNQNKSRSNFFV
jgi:hypothetical protein